jgi:phosphoribosylamine--glycine ligase
VRILVVGGGGREHALLWALRREDPTAEFFSAPGNPGTASIGTNLPIAADDLTGLARAAGHSDIDLTIIGPEAPLAGGLADRLRAEGRAVFGPAAAAAQLEASKAFSKEVMRRAEVPTADAQTFSSVDVALAYIRTHPEPLVVKASGLAAGKGVIVCETRADAMHAVQSILTDRRFGDAGTQVLVERFLEGEETSILAVTDGEDVVLLPPSQDHKRKDEGDTGPNTGGMGAYSPVSIVTPEFLARVREEILLPTLLEMRRAGARFTGLLYAGLMIDAAGDPWVVEFNCRFGDPEAQVVLPLLEGGLTECLGNVAHGRPPTPIPARSDAASVTTVLAARGYPERPEKGAEIVIPDDLPPDVIVFHAGTKRDDAGTLRVNGGRVLNVTAVAPNVEEARRLSREAAERITFDGKHYRRDIGWREAERIAQAR